MTDREQQQQRYIHDVMTRAEDKILARLQEEAAALDAERESAVTALPEPTVRPVEYVVSCLPEDFPEGDLLAIKVTDRGSGRWAVTNRSRYLGDDGAWSWGHNWGGGGEPTNDAEWDDYHASRDQWQAAHRFDLDAALKLAKEAALHVTVGGRSVADVLRAAADRTEQP